MTVDHTAVAHERQPADRPGQSDRAIRAGSVPNERAAIRDDQAVRASTARDGQTPNSDEQDAGAAGAPMGPGLTRDAPAAVAPVGPGLGGEAPAAVAPVGHPLPAGVPPLVPPTANPLVGGPAFAAAQVGLIAAAGVVLLLILSPLYGFHRDELYFIVAGRHPALGYPDQPALTPLLSAAAVWLFGLSPTAIRILPALVLGALVVVTALVARDMGGSRRAQVLAALTLGLSGYLAAGHLDSTATYDLLAWGLVLWLVIRLLAGADRRLWLVVGIVAGIGLENKDTILFLALGLAGGVVLARRWDVLRSPWAWSAIVIAAVLWLPNLAWQAANDFPQLTMARAIAGSAGDNRAKLLPELLLLSGPLLFPVPLAGAWRLLRSTATARWRVVGYAFLVTLVVVFVTGGKSYYAVGYSPVLMAAGAIALDGWLSRGRARLRAGVFGSAAAESGVLVAVLVLPLQPPATRATTPMPASYNGSAEQIGWPELVTAVEHAVATLPAAERSHAMILTANYGEAGALDLLGSGLPPVYSGHTGFWYWGPPPADRTVVVLVGHWDFGHRGSPFGPCTVLGHVDNGIGLANQEQGAGIDVCGPLPVAWPVLWPELLNLH